MLYALLLEVHGGLVLYRAEMTYYRFHREFFIFALPFAPTRAASRRRLASVGRCRP